MKQLFLAIVALMVACIANAQGMKDPSAWTATVVAGKGIYDIVFEVKLEPKWHLWAMNPGGDGTLIAPEFKIESGFEQLIGKPVEMGVVTEEEMEGIEGKVRFFTGKAQFIQSVKASSGSTVKGTYSYQLCNDMMCLPPKTVPFSVKIP